MRFCQSFMTELFRHIGPNTDVPGGRHRRRRPRDRLPLRPVQAAAQRVHRRADRQGPELGRLADPARGDRLRLRVLRRGDAGHARRDARRARRAWSRAAATSRSTRSRSCSSWARRPVTLSDSNGYIYDEAGIDREKLAFVMELKNVRRGRIQEYADKFKGAAYTADRPGARSQPAVEPQGRLRVPQRDAERDQRQGRREPAAERRLRRLRGREHADRRSTASTQFVDARHPLRPGQGGERRRRRRLGPRDGAEQHALRLDARGGRQPAAPAS